MSSRSRQTAVPKGAVLDPLLYSPSFRTYDSGVAELMEHARTLGIARSAARDAVFGGGHGRGPVGVLVGVQAFAPVLRARSTVVGTTLVN